MMDLDELIRAEQLADALSHCLPDGDAKACAQGALDILKHARSERDQLRARVADLEAIVARVGSALVTLQERAKMGGRDDSRAGQSRGLVDAADAVEKALQGET